MFDSHSVHVLFESCLEIKYLNSDVRDFFLSPSCKVQQYDPETNNNPVIDVN
jgi:hypothetical protein